MKRFPFLFFSSHLDPVLGVCHGPLHHPELHHLPGPGEGEVAGPQLDEPLQVGGQTQQHLAFLGQLQVASSVTAVETNCKVVPQNVSNFFYVRAKT